MLIRHSRRKAGVTAGAMGLVVAALVAGLAWTTSAAAAADSERPGASSIAESKFEPMPAQTYALCAGAKSFNFDGVTYAKCRLKDGNSLAMSHPFPGGNALTVNQLLTAAGSSMVSTYSPPSPKRYAVYQCSRDGAYAQCNGGLCYRYDGEFPGLGEVGENQVICSCPIVYTKKTYHVNGPAQCPTTRAAYDEICGSGSRADMTAAGTILHIGSGGPAATQHQVDNRIYDDLFGTTTPAPPTCKRPAR